MKTTKYIFCDIDGTLLLKGETLSRNVIEKVKKLRDKHIQFTFASGRLEYMITPLLNVLDLADMPYVACNGALVKQGNSIIFIKKFQLRLLKKLVAKALELGMTVLYAFESEEFLLQENTATLRKKAERGWYHQVRELSGNEWEEGEILKLNILADDSEFTIEDLSEEIRILKNQLLFTYYGNVGLEIVANGVSKLTGVEKILETQGISLKETAAIGDNGNDIELIEAVGRGFAVKNATKELATVADYQLSGVAADGVVEALEKILKEVEEK